MRRLYCLYLPFTTINNNFVGIDWKHSNLHDIVMIFSEINMTIAYWCVLAMILFPYVFTVLAKYSAHYNNHDPRHYLETTTGWRRRAHYIQLNSFEALPAFGLAVIISHLAHASQTSLNTAAIIFVIARIFYAIFYLFDIPKMRSLCWFIGMACVVRIFCISY